MSSFVFMKLLETSSDRYDAGMALLGLGSVDRIYRSVAALVPAGSEVVEVGCGTGGVTSYLTQRCSHVTAIDRSEAMLTVARRKLAAPIADGRLDLRQLNLVALDRAFSDASCDCVVSCLVLSELSATEEAYALDQFCRLVRPGGSVVVADEVAPQSVARRLAYRALRAPLAAVTYLVTQTSTHNTTDLAAKLAGRGLRIAYLAELSGGTVQVIEGRRPQCEYKSE